MGGEGSGGTGAGLPGLEEVDVDAPTGWRVVPMSDSSGPVEVRLLRRFSAGSTSVLVRFPAGWSRPAAGFYAAAELFVVLDGTLHLGDLSFGGATGGYLRAYVPRERTRTPGGALAWAHFDGPAEFVRSGPRGATPPPGGPIVPFALRGDRPAEEPCRVLARHPDGWASAVVDHAGDVGAGPAELLAPVARRWVHAGEGARVPALRGPVLLRRPERVADVAPATPVTPAT